MQPPPAVSPEIRALVDSGPLVHVTTLNRDGSPQVSLVWVGLEDGEFVTAHMGAWRKVRNLQRDPRVALSMLGRGRNAMGLHEYLVVYGTARVTEGGAAALLQRLARRCFRPNPTAASPASSFTSPRSGLPESARGVPGSGELTAARYIHNM
jgi:PPOX class probable F420-dependent enzyme